MGECSSCDVKTTGGGRCIPICCGYEDVPPVRVYFLKTCVLPGDTFLSIFLVCVLSGMRFSTSE